MAQVLRYLNSSEDNGGGGSNIGGGSGIGDGMSMMGGRPGRIVNRKLLVAPRQEEGEGTEESREERKARWAAKAADSAGAAATSYVTAAAPPKAHLLTAFANYEVDYHLVGPALWDLLSTKFGYDVAIPFPLRVQRGWGKSVLSVVVRNELFDDGKDDDDDLYGGIINTATAAGGGKQDSSQPKYKSTIVDGVKETLIPVPDSGKWNYGGMDDRVMKKARDREASAPTSPVGGDGDAKLVSVIKCGLFHYVLVSVG